MHMLVFRSDAGRETVSSQYIIRELQGSIAGGDTLAALISAGEIESALEDAGSASALSCTVTDSLAKALASFDETSQHLAEAAALVQFLEAPETLIISAPEGFCYYAVHPLDFVDAVRELGVSGPCTVIGIRSIGTTLSAVAAAALGCERITVRPTGHPYDRTTKFTLGQRKLVRDAAARNSIFIVVDEGPGLSGSSFLSVGESLVAAGVDPRAIHLICSREFDPAALVTSDAARRCGSFSWHTVRQKRRAPDDAAEFPNGDWREHFLGDVNRDLWPAAWTQLGVPKFLSRNGRSIYKYEGLGRHGARVRERSAKLAASGFGPRVTDAGNGYSAYELLSGKAIVPEDVVRGVLERIADYLAFRATEFRTTSCDSAALEQMARFNHQQIWDKELQADFSLPVVTPVIADGRMTLHEWLLTPDGQMLKLDGAAHGDNHFYPGPVDIAWDLAGVVVEWKLDAGSQESLLDHYFNLTGDDARTRLKQYVIAYAAFQCGYALMAAQAMSGTAEEQRLLRDAARYRAVAKTMEAAPLAAAI